MSRLFLELTMPTPRRERVQAFVEDDDGRNARRICVRWLDPWPPPTDPAFLETALAYFGRGGIEAQIRDAAAAYLELLPGVRVVVDVTP